MTATHETAYPRLKPNPTPDELEKNFKPTHEEIILMEEETHYSSAANKLGFMVILKCFQCLGYVINLANVPETIIAYIRLAIAVSEEVDLANYSPSTKTRHRKTILKYLNISDASKKQREHMKDSALKSASFKESLADIINDMIETLVKERFELPGFSTLERLARAARVLVNARLYEQITHDINDESKIFLDTLFDTSLAPDSATSGWAFLKKEMKSPSTQNVKLFVDDLNKLKSWQAEAPATINQIPAHRLEQFIEEAMALDSADMKNLKPEKRYALAVTLLHFKLANRLDDIAAVFIRWMRKMRHEAKMALDEYTLSKKNETDSLVNILHGVLLASNNIGTPAERLQAIEISLPEDKGATIELCERYLAHSGDNYLPFMIKLYQNKRYVLFRLLEQISLQSASQDKSLEYAVSFIITNRHSKQKTCSIIASKFDQLSWLSEKWFNFVTNNNRNDEIMEVNKKNFELAVFNALADEINCADMFLLGANHYDDPNKPLISWDEFDSQLDNYCNLIKQPSKPSEFISLLQTQHYTAAKITDGGFLANEYLSIEKGEPVLKRALTKKEDKAITSFVEQVSSRIPLTNIVDVFVDIEQWLGISKTFKPLSGHEAKIKDYDMRFVATSFAYGCNVGPVQAERCLQKYTRKQIAWLFNHHITDYRLSKATEKVINAYNQFELPKSWGTGETGSVDGTYWNIFTNNLLAEHHIRYGQYGGIGYYHVSDQYIALFSNFIPCGVYEATFIFDGIIENESDIQPKTIHGDTGAQSEVVFAFAYLLAIQLMPRIRNFKHLKYYRPVMTDGDVFEHIDSIFTNDRSDWGIIEAHYHDMLRVVMSIQSGKIKASTILRKLCSQSRKNKIYQAFRELGRIIRTTFLLNYINDIELRRMIQAATCKSEEFNNFIDWVAFGRDGVIEDNLLGNQKKIINYGRLVGNSVMLHVVANMTHAINELKVEGLDITPDMLNGLSPYHTGHINRFGVFYLSMNKEKLHVEYKLS
ncbi:TPA: Tn3 family transposase [Legionella pneumophila]